MKDRSGCGVIIKGRVQGVCYRSAACEKAKELGLEGWVRNLPDGRVEALFVGDTEKIKEMIEWCYTGPPEANVTSVETEWRACTEGLEGFKIAY